MRLLGDGQVRNDVLTAETEDIAAVLRYTKRTPPADASENRQVGRCRLRIRIPPGNHCNTLRTVRIRLERQIVIYDRTDCVLCCVAPWNQHRLGICFGHDFLPGIMAKVEIDSIGIEVVDGLIK